MCEQDNRVISFSRGVLRIQIVLERVLDPNELFLVSPDPNFMLLKMVFIFLPWLQMQYCSTVSDFYQLCILKYCLDTNNWDRVSKTNFNWSRPLSRAFYIVFVSKLWRYHFSHPFEQRRLRLHLSYLYWIAWMSCTLCHTIRLLFFFLLSSWKYHILKVSS